MYPTVVSEVCLDEGEPGPPDESERGGGKP
ncbi:hypothetical protein SAMN05216285_1160 [Natrinema salifodinae]|uniref:Uncharacterized protein n=1 Tax=Natrinema salifodinae TaxID=1202768 RepID=A0A1I0MYY6_9EURY|nr:hypothetical protein SAMN05216285_1160 [Natrinema salifodinae]